MPVLTEAFERIGATLDRLEQGQIEEVVTVGCNSTFANGWLLQHLDEFRSKHPLIDLRLLINNNRVDVAGDGLDLALRFGDRKSTRLNSKSRQYLVCRLLLEKKTITS